MSKIELIRNKMIESRKAKDEIAKSLFITLYSEASKVGKDKRNGDPTDDECMSVIKKFIDNARETVKILECKVPQSNQFLREIDLLSDLLPAQLSKEELTYIIKKIVTDHTLDKKGMGKVMAELKANYNGQYDGKMASEICKELL